MAGFQKTISSFPQELTELKHFQNYLLDLTEGDVIHFLPEVNSEAALLTGRILDISQTGFRVETADAETQNLSIPQIKRRVALPWKPVDLLDYLIMF